MASLFRYFVFSLVLELLHALDGSLSTGSAGVNTIDGHIFEIKTKSYPVAIERLDIHMTASTAPIQVWYRPGSQSPSYVDTYMNALDTQVTGNGMNAMTPLPAFTTPIVIPADSTYTFYVTTSKNGASTMYYEFGTSLGQILASDEMLDIHEGYVLRYSFSSPGYPRKWNGVIHYTTTVPLTSGSPTKMPTPLSTTKQPTHQPTTKPPTKKPISTTSSPTTKPFYMAETLSPTATYIDTLAPTFSENLPTDTLSPTAGLSSNPISANIETLNPTLKDTLWPTETSITPDPTVHLVDTLAPTLQTPSPNKPSPKPSHLPIDLRSLTVNPTGKTTENEPQSPTAKPTQVSSNLKKRLENAISIISIVAAFLM